MLADHCGDLGYPIFTLPIVRQKQMLVSKRLESKRRRQKFNNMSRKRKNEMRRKAIQMTKEFAKTLFK